MNSAIRNRLITGFLLALFIIPMLAAGIMYVTGKGIPHKTVNHGALINPPLAFNKLGLLTPDQAQPDKLAKLNGKWLLIYINPQPCRQGCLDTLYKIRQTHTALNKDSDRLVRVLITTEPLAVNSRQPIIKGYPGTQSYAVSGKALTTFLANSPFSAETLTKGRLYVVDPLGNIMMTYALDIAFEPLLSDLKRLLQLSQIG